MESPVSTSLTAAFIGIAVGQIIPLYQAAWWTLSCLQWKSCADCAKEGYVVQKYQFKMNDST